jgi:hypothetical protein
MAEVPAAVTVEMIVFAAPIIEDAVGTPIAVIERPIGVVVIAIITHHGDARTAHVSRAVVGAPGQKGKDGGGAGDR